MEHEKETSETRGRWIDLNGERVWVDGSDNIGAVILEHVAGFKRSDGPDPNEEMPQ